MIEVDRPFDWKIADVGNGSWAAGQTKPSSGVPYCKIMGQLLHGAETRVYGDQAYKSQKQVIRAKAPNEVDR